MRARWFFFATYLTATLGLAVTVKAQVGLEADAAAFRLDSASDQVEIYYAVLQRGLKFTQNGTAWEAPFNARVELWQNGKVVDRREIAQQIRYAVTKEQLDSISANKLVGMTAFQAHPAASTYAAFIWQRGSATAADTIRSEQLDLPSPQSSKIELGGIELGSSLEPGASATNVFDKAGYVLTPNPSSVYGENYTHLYYYSELYVPKAMVSNDESLTVTTRIVDGSGKQILAKSEKHTLSATTIPIIVALDIDGLPQDRYRLQVQVKQDEGVIAQREKAFFFVSGMQISDDAASPAQGQSPQQLYGTSPFANVTDAAADELIAQSLYVGADADRAAAKKLSTLDAKRHFLFEFWVRKDAPGAPALSAFAEYSKRLAFVADKFSYQRTPGWKTPRGRVYLVYGPYLEDDYEEHLFDPETKPYMIWRYNPDPNIRINSGTKPEFVFLDRQGGGNFVLVHSNVIGEVSEPGWYSLEAHRLVH